MPVDPLHRFAWGLVALGLVIALPFLGLYVRSIFQRAYLSPAYSPLARRRAAWGITAAALPLLLAAGVAVFAHALSAYPPARPGEPVGLVWAEKRSLMFESSADGSRRSLGPVPGKPFALAGDVLEFPGWTGILGLGTRQRIRGAIPPYRTAATPPPEGDLLYSLVASGWFPGSARSIPSPTIRLGGGRVEVLWLEGGGYGVAPYPGRPGG